MNTHGEPKTRTTPEVDMAATYCIGGDCYAMIVTATTPKSVTASFADIITDGGTYVLVAKGRDKKFTLRADGTYRPVGTHAGSLSIGQARSYMDPSF